jgi:hypothetical protein
MVALARNLNFFGSRVLTGLTAVFIIGLRGAPAWQVCTFVLPSCRHHCSPFSFLVFGVKQIGVKLARKHIACRGLAAMHHFGFCCSICVSTSIR